MKRLALFLALVLVPCAVWAQKGFVGKYAVAGWEAQANAAGSPEYAGEVEIKALGDGYVFSGVVDGQTYRGTGLANPASDVLAFVFTEASGKETGLTLLTPGEKGLAARWIRLDDPSGKAGVEIWSPLE